MLKFILSTFIILILAFFGISACIVSSRFEDNDLNNMEEDKGDNND